MKRCFAVLLTVLALTSVAGCGGHPNAAAPVPPCPHASYSADGNLVPLFCTIANPAALAWYGKLAPQLLRLGADATPPQVLAAFRDADARHITPPQACQAWRLFSYRWGWDFGGYVPLPEHLNEDLWCS